MKLRFKSYIVNFPLFIKAFSNLSCYHRVFLYVSSIYFIWLYDLQERSHQFLCDPGVFLNNLVHSIGWKLWCLVLKMIVKLWRMAILNSFRPELVDSSVLITRINFHSQTILQCGSLFQINVKLYLGSVTCSKTVSKIHFLLFRLIFTFEICHTWEQFSYDA